MVHWERLPDLLAFAEQNRISYITSFMTYCEGNWVINFADMPSHLGLIYFSIKTGIYKNVIRLGCVSAQDVSSQSLVDISLRYAYM